MEQTGRSHSKGLIQNILNCISLLQESPAQQTEKLWTDVWKEKIFFSHGTSQSSRVPIHTSQSVMVGILFPQNYDFEICDKKTRDTTYY